MTSYYDSIELLDQCNSIDAADLINEPPVYSSRRVKEHGLNEYGKRSRASSVSSEYELPVLHEADDSHDDFKDISLNIQSAITEAYTILKSRINTKQSSELNNQLAQLSTKHKKSKKHNAHHNNYNKSTFIPVTWDPATFVNYYNFSSTNETINYETRVLVNSVVSQGIAGINLENLFQNGYGPSQRSPKDVQIAGKTSLEIALRILNRRLQLDDIQLLELQRREEAKQRELEEKQRREQEQQRMRQLEKQAAEQNVAQEQARPDTISQAATAAARNQNGGGINSNGQTEEGLKDQSNLPPLTVQNYTEALTNLLKNRNLNLPQLTPEQIAAVAKNPTFQNNQIITNFLRLSMRNNARANGQGAIQKKGANASAGKSA